MGETRSRSIVLDAGALLAFERGDARLRELIRAARAAGVRLIVPAGVVGQVIRDRARQVTVRALLDADTTDVPVLDRVLAEVAGALCGRAGTADVIDASVVLAARRARAAVVTGDERDLRRLDATLTLHVV